MIIYMRNKKVCNKTRSPPASLLFKGQGTEHTTVKWSNRDFKIQRRDGKVAKKLS